MSAEKTIATLVGKLRFDVDSAPCYGLKSS